MSYALGVDLGTTYTSAAAYENGQARVIDLAGRSATMPSIIYLDENGSYLVGDAAVRRAVADPTRAAQQFKRRFGDTTPIFLGGSPLSADALSAELLKAVIALVSERQGGPPDSIALTHPANWGGYKLELLDQAVSRAGLVNVTMITEPEAAVLHYAQLERVPNDALVAVFDLGGGTFDAAIVRKTDAGTEFLGRPEGIERLGGIDFDQAVYAFVLGHLDGAVDALDIDDPTSRAAIERLRRECVDAKEALSDDEAVSIPVLLPNLQTTVRMTRSEFEGLIRPVLVQAIDALQRALQSADVTVDDVHAVLLAGGSSRIPLVAELVTNELGRPVAVDAHPKQVVSMGAAYAAHLAAQPSAAAAGVTAAAGVAAAAAATSSSSAEAAEVGAPGPPTTAATSSTSTPTESATSPGGPPPPVGTPKSKSKVPIIIGAVAAMIVAVGAIVAFGGGGDSNDASDAVASAATPVAPTTAAAPAAAVATTPVTTVAPATTEAPATTTAPTTTTTTTTTTTLPFPAETRRVGLTGIALVGNRYEVAYETTNFEPLFGADAFHMHFHWNTFTPESVGTASDPRGDWTVWDLRSDGAKVFDSFTADSVPAGATAICAVVATENHAIDAPEFVADTVSCVDLPA